MSTRYKVTIAGKEYELQYRLKERRAIEAAAREEAGGAVGMGDCLRSPVLVFQAILIWGGIKAGVEDKELSVDDVIDLLSAHAEDGGDLTMVNRVVRRAALESRAMGVFDEKVINSIAPAVKASAEAIVPQ